MQLASLAVRGAHEVISWGAINLVSNEVFSPATKEERVLVQELGAVLLCLKSSECKVCLSSPSYFITEPSLKITI